MNELRRLEYLRAMGAESYISRLQLPGAAVSQRLMIVPRVSPLEVVAMIGESAAALPGPERQKGPRPAIGMNIEIPDIQAPRASSSPVVVGSTPGQGLPPSFSLAAVACGGWLWLESLEEAPMLPAQLQLVQSMADALHASGVVSGAAQREAGSVKGAAAQVTQFDWPMHRNQQLDHSREAARSSVAAFIQRRLEVLGCGGLVLLGRKCEALVAVDQLECSGIARTASTAEMLETPLLKKQAWQELQAFTRPL